MLRNGCSELVSWIPSKFAKQDKILKLFNNGVWEDGWKVVSVGTETDEQYIPDVYSLAKGLWKATSGDYPIRHK